MNEYYGMPSTPTEDFLAHYGVKGMKWGVRKAIARGDQKKLDEHFAKASSKLKKLAAKRNKAKYNKFREEMHFAFANTKHDAHQNEKMRSTLDAMYKMEDDFWKSPARDKILRQLAKESAKKYSDGSKEAVKKYYWGYKYDDLDNGESFERYRKQNPKVDAQYRKLSKQYDDEAARLRKNPRY